MNPNMSLILTTGLGRIHPKTPLFHQQSLNALVSKLHIANASNEGFGSWTDVPEILSWSNFLIYSPDSKREE